MTAPSKFTIKQMQELVHAHAMADLDNSTWNAYTDDELRAFAAHIRSSNINESPAIVIDAILARREHLAAGLEAEHVANLDRLFGPFGKYFVKR